MSRGGVVDYANAGFITDSEAAAEEIGNDTAASVGVPVPTDQLTPQQASEIIADLVGERDEALEALRELSDMYGHTWDLVDGGAMMMEKSTKVFEKAHAKAKKVLDKAAARPEQRSTKGT